MINKDIIEAFSMLAKEKNIDRTNLSTIIEDIFMTLIYKKYGEERENFSVIVNMEKGEIEIYQEMTVVKNVQDSINYRTFRPEKDGLFCARIFGPIKDFTTDFVLMMNTNCNAWCEHSFFFLK